MLSKSHLSCYRDFWVRHPALLYGLSMQLGILLALSPPPLYLVCFFAAITWLPFFLFIDTRAKRLSQASIRPLFSLLFICFSYLYAHHQYLLPLLTQEEVGMAHVEFFRMSSSNTSFGKLLTYHGTLKSFHRQDGTLFIKNAPIRMLWNEKKMLGRPLAHHSYKILARIKNHRPPSSEKNSANHLSGYSLHALQSTKWQPIDAPAINLTEWRFESKGRWQAHLHESIKDRHVVSFLTGIATGEYDDIALSAELGRFGLQHLMAISGLHFSIAASLIATAAALFLPMRQASLAVLIALSFYFIWLGTSPSILRAYLAILIAFFGSVIERRGSALNSLGIGLMASCLIDPLMLFTIGWQFSFGITYAILAWHQPCDLLCQKIFPSRSLNQLASLDVYSQHAYCLLSFLRQGIALSLAINLAALPLTLLYFNKFPLLSLLYNLFFPMLVSLCLLLLFLASLASIVSSALASFLHYINGLYTQFILDLLFHFPKSFDVTFYSNELSPHLLFAYFALLFSIGILIDKQEKDAPLGCESS